MNTCLYELSQRLSLTDSPITMTIVSWLLLFIHYLVLSSTLTGQNDPVRSKPITEEEIDPVVTTTEKDSDEG